MTLRDHPDLHALPVASPADELLSDGDGPSAWGTQPKTTVTPPPVVRSAKSLARSANNKRKQDEEAAKLEKLGAAQYAEDELAEALGVKPEALAKRMTGRKRARLAYEKGRAAGVMALRSAQLKLAETSAPMAIFLGRVYLGQSERQEVDPGESNEIREVAQSVRDRIAALVAEANRNRGPYPGGDGRDA
jgi:hypothetical protein